MKENTEPTAEKQTFLIDSEDRAAWLLRKLKAIRAEQEGIRAATEKRLEELESDYRALVGKFGQQLESWAQGEAEKRRRRTVTVPLAGCSLAFRTVPGKLVESAEGGPTRAEIAATLGFMTEPQEPAPDLRKLSEHARQHFAETGEILPGYEFAEARQSFKIDFSLKGESATE